MGGGERNQGVRLGVKEIWGCLIPIGRMIKISLYSTILLPHPFSVVGRLLAIIRSVCLVSM